MTKSNPRGVRKTIEAWAVVGADGLIPTGIYRERDIFRIYENREAALGGKFEMFENQRVVPAQITFHLPIRNKKSV